VSATTQRMLQTLQSRRIVDMRVDATSYGDATDRIVRWAEARESRSVFIATVNNVMEAHEDRSFLDVMNGSDLTTPDGMPLVWGLKILGVKEATRVYGPELTPNVMRAAADRGIPVGFYGGSPETLEILLERARGEYPGLEVAFHESPPFRELTATEDAATVERVTASGARVLFIGLGCPKQERWIAEHRGRIPAVMVGVGAAFDFLAGTKRQAPRLLQRLGLEWLFRLASEPRRLWRRYLRHNPRFVALFARQVLLGRREAPRVADPRSTGDE
jgi:N-acetylglucosaminyldiphosphoundecaprenol N-acetyl-beta-D-mannosaminyltransferase